MKKIYALIATIVVLAAASAAVIVNAGKPDSFLEANVEALADVETLPPGYTECFLHVELDYMPGAILYVRRCSDCKMVYALRASSADNCML